MHNNNNIKLLIIFLLIIILFFIIIGDMLYKTYKYNQTTDYKLSDSNNALISLENSVNNQKQNSINQNSIIQNGNNIISNTNIIKYEFKRNYLNKNISNNNKFFINSEIELNKFFDIFSCDLDINKDYLGNNSIFIEIQSVSSGSTSMKLSSVTFDNNTINFVIDRNNPEIGTCDIAVWYFVAIIPNDQLNGLNLTDWKKPSETIFTDN